MPTYITALISRAAKPTAKLFSLMFGFIFLSISTTSQASPDKLIVCADKGYWYPFVFTEGYEAKGLYIDMLNDAADRLDLRISIRPMDWKKCLRKAKTGKVGGIIGVSYKDSRAEFLDYPDNAKTDKVSDLRLTQVEYVIVNNADSPYIFDGNVSTLPQPVRVPRGYSVADDLKNDGLANVNTKSKGDQGTLLRLISEKQGSVVTLATVAKHFENHRLFKGKLKTQKRPYKSKSYFLAFSKNKPTDEAKRIEIWKALQAVRSDSVLMESYMAKY
jgi:polar amino acid transport system substrate-binding protein